MHDVVCGMRAGKEERLSSRQTESYHCERSCGFCAFACEQEYLVE